MDVLKKSFWYIGRSPDMTYYADILYKIRYTSRKKKVDQQNTMEYI